MQVAKILRQMHWCDKITKSSSGFKGPAQAAACKQSRSLPCDAFQVHPDQA